MIQKQNISHEAHLVISNMQPALKQSLRNNYAKNFPSSSIYLFTNILSAF